MSKLEILTGLRAQHQFLIESDSIWIGSDTGCEICIQEPGVSRRHAQILRTDEELFWIIDAGGSFGTLLNGKNIEKALLEPGDELTLGRIKLRFAEEKTQFVSMSPFLEDSLSALVSPEQMILDDFSLDLDPSERTNVTPSDEQKPTPDHQELVVASLSDFVYELDENELADANLSDSCDVNHLNVLDSWESQDALSGTGTQEGIKPTEEIHPDDIHIHSLSEEDMLDEEWIDLTDDELEPDEEESSESEPLVPKQPQAILQPVTLPSRSTPPTSSPAPTPPPISSPRPKKTIPSDEVFGRHTLTRIRAGEVLSASREKLGLEEKVKEATSATRSRADLFQAEIGRLKQQLESREHHIAKMNQESNQEKLAQQQNSLLETTLSLYRENNERLKIQLGVYEEAAIENENLLKKMEQFTREIEDLSVENKMLRRRLLQHRRLLVQHGLLRSLKEVQTND